MSSGVKKKAKRALDSAVRGLRKFAYACPLPERYRRSLEAMNRRPRVGLALGGGFARGLAHVGVLKVLLENQIPIDALAGISVGSIVAAAFASGCTIGKMLEAAHTVHWRNFARWTIPRMGFASNAKMEAMLHELLPQRRFEELRTPLAVVATDLSTGEAVVFREGDLIPPLRASCAFPGLFVPVEYHQRLLADGAIVGSMPVAALRDFRVDKVVAVHLRTGNPRERPTNLFQVVGQAFQIAEALAQNTWRKDCDLVIEPEVGQFGWDAFDRADELIGAGEQAARQALPELRALTAGDSGVPTGSLMNP
jgi:NTE family protein